MPSSSQAAQFNYEIISIGCVREDGERFYSLIRPKNMSTITSFITKLTGITKDMLKEEKKSDAVFEEFYDWLMEVNEPVEFFCYGNADDDFLNKNLRSRTKSLKAQAAISLILTNLHDYSVDVKEHFELSKSIALKKVMDYYYPGDEHVCHNALSDAEMLYYVHNSVESEAEVNGVPFPDYIDIPVFKTAEEFARFQIERINSNGVCKELYESLQEAVTYLIAIMQKQGITTQYKPDNIAKRLMYAINNRKKYFGYEWQAKVRRD